MAYKILVITAEVGESQLNDAIKSVKDQLNVEVEHVIISNKPTLVAEKEIYMTAFKHKEHFDYIARLDGDMVLKSITALYSMSNLLDLHPNICRLSVPVHDFYTNEQIQGFHIMRSSGIPKQVEVNEYKPEKWIEELPSKTIRTLKSPLVLHGHNPNLDQAIRFGLHRGLKALKTGPRSTHWRTINALRVNLRLESKLNPISANTYKLKIAYVSILLVLGSYSKKTFNWEAVNFDSITNKEVKKSINNILDTRYDHSKDTSIHTFISLHYASFNSYYESIRIIISIYYNKYKSKYFRVARMI